MTLLKGDVKGLSEGSTAVSMSLTPKAPLQDGLLAPHMITLTLAHPPRVLNWSPFRTRNPSHESSFAVALLRVFLQHRDLRVGIRQGFPLL